MGGIFICFCPVCLSVCLSVVNFNLHYYFWTIRDRDFIFGMHTPLMTPFQMTTTSVPRDLDFDLETKNSFRDFVAAGCISHLIRFWDVCCIMAFWPTFHAPWLYFRSRKALSCMRYLDPWSPNQQQSMPSTNFWSGSKRRKIDYLFWTLWHFNFIFTTSLVYVLFLLILLFLCHCKLLCLNHETFVYPFYKMLNQISVWIICPFVCKFHF